MSWAWQAPTWPEGCTTPARLRAGSKFENQVELTAADAGGGDDDGHGHFAPTILNDCRLRARVGRVRRGARQLVPVRVRGQGTTDRTTQSWCRDVAEIR